MREEFGGHPASSQDQPITPTENRIPHIEGLRQSSSFLAHKNRQKKFINTNKRPQRIFVSKSQQCILVKTLVDLLILRGVENI